MSLTWQYPKFSAEFCQGEREFSSDQKVVSSGLLGAYRPDLLLTRPTGQFFGFQFEIGQSPQENDRRVQTPAVDVRPEVEPETGPKSLRVEERPLDATPRSTAELPPTPQRDRRIRSTSWTEAPTVLHALGADLGWDEVLYLRAIGGRWLLWRAGPAVDAESRYGAIDLANDRALLTFDLHADGSGSGVGADGQRYDRFRTWKESLRDA